MQCGQKSQTTAVCACVKLTAVLAPEIVCGAGPVTQHPVSAANPAIMISEQTNFIFNEKPIPLRLRLI